MGLSPGEPFSIGDLTATIGRFAPQGSVYETGRKLLFDALEAETSNVPVPILDDERQRKFGLRHWTLARIFMAQLECRVRVAATSELEAEQRRRYQADRRRLESTLANLRDHPLVASLDCTLHEFEATLGCPHGRPRMDCERRYAQRQLLELARTTGILHMTPTELGRFDSDSAALLEQPRSKFCEPDALLPVRETTRRGRGAPENFLQNHLLKAIVPTWNEARIANATAFRFIARILVYCFPGPRARPKQLDDLVEDIADSLPRQWHRLQFPEAQKKRRAERRTQSGQ